MLNPNQIRQARGTLCLSQRELARRANISRTALNQFEQGKVMPGFHFSRKLREFFEAEGIDIAIPTDSITSTEHAKGQEFTTEELVGADPDQVADASEEDDDLTGAIVMLLGLGLSMLLGRRIGP